MTAACPLCHCDRTAYLFHSRDRVHGLPGVFSVFQCGRCRAVFYRPSLSGEELSRYYPETYGRYRVSRSLERKSYDRGLGKFVLENHYGYPRRTRTPPSLTTRWLAFLLSFVTARGALPYRGDGNFLDVGCGGGSYLYRLKQWGWNVYGVEPSAAGAARARSLGLNVHQGFVEDAGFPENFFDVVRLHHVLEHLTDPGGTFLEIKRILKPDGIVYVTVPNTRSLNFWLWGENWYGLDTPRHVISYCPETLKFLCAATGFGIVRIRCRSGAFNFVRSVPYFLEQNANHWPEWVRRINWPSNKLIRRTLKPGFFLVDRLRVGDVIVALLSKASPVGQTGLHY